MFDRENETHSKSLRFSGDEVVLAVQLLEKVEPTMHVVYYLMDHEDAQSFVLLLVSANNIELLKMLNEQKRDTDILFEIDSELSLYAVLCQDTKIDGGYRFAERILEILKEEDASDIYCTELEIRSTQHETKKVVFKLIETYIRARQENKYGEIIFKTLQ